MQTTTKPQLLFLSHLLPYPPDSGAAIRTYNVLRILSSAFNVTALCFSRKSQSAQAGSARERAAALAEFCHVEVFPIPAESSRLRLGYDHLRSIARRRPYVDFIYQSGKFRTRLRELLASRRFALVHVDSLDLASYLPEVAHLPTVCAHHNVESGLLHRRAEAEGLPLLRAYLRFQAGLLEHHERGWCERMDLNIAVSEEDRRQFLALAPGARFEVFPNGVDVRRYYPEPGQEDGLVFVGGTTWFPNRDALAYLCESVLPPLHERGISPAIRWVGQAFPSDRQQFGNVPGLTLTGYVEDERPWVRDAACFIVPLRVGGGTRLKIVNAWAMGKAVVSTSVGCEGLAAVHGKNILIADRPEDFAAAIAQVLHDPDLRRRLGAAGRATAETEYAWSVIGQRMIDGYLRLLAGARENPPARQPAASGRGGSLS